MEAIEQYLLDASSAAASAYAEGMAPEAHVRHMLTPCVLMQKGRVYEKLRVERMNARREGMRKKRAAEAEAEKDK